MGQQQGKLPKDEKETSDDAAENLVESDSEDDRHGDLDLTGGAEHIVKVSMCVDGDGEEEEVSDNEHVLQADRVNSFHQSEASDRTSDISDVGAQRETEKESSNIKHVQLKKFAEEESSYLLLEKPGNLQDALDQAALTVKEQNFFSKDLELETTKEGRSSRKHNTENDKPRTKAKRSKSRMRRFFNRKSVMKVMPEEKLEGHASVLDLRAYNNPVTPTGIFDIAVIPPPPEFEDLGDDLTMTENRDLYEWLMTEELVPSAMSDWPLAKPEAEHVTVTQLYNSMNDGQKSCYLFDPSFLLIIDVRIKEDYLKNHINTAHHVSELQQNLSGFGPMDEYTLIVVYDEFGMSYSLTDSKLSIAMDQLIAKKADAFVLEGGFRAFQLRHPYLCTCKIPENEVQRQELVPNYPSIIVDDQLYLGRVDQACQESTVRNLKITHVICITQETTMPYPEFITYHHIKLGDEPNSCLHASFPDAIRFIVDATGAGGRVFVHCNLGQSRSATIVIAYLMYTRKWTLDDAYNFVREQRPVIHPNEGFMCQLSNFEKALFGKRITKVESYGFKLVCLKQKIKEDIPAAEPKEQKMSKKQKYKIKKNKNKEKESECQHAILDYEKLGDESDSGECEDVTKEGEKVPEIVELDTSLQAEAIPTNEQQDGIIENPAADAYHLLDTETEDGRRSRSSSRGSSRGSSPRYTRMSEEAAPQVKKTKKTGLIKILVASSGVGSADRDGKAKANVTETASEGDDISLIGDLNGEINECLSGFSNVVHGAEPRNLGQGQARVMIGDASHTTHSVSHDAMIEEISHL